LEATAFVVWIAGLVLRLVALRKFDPHQKFLFQVYLCLNLLLSTALIVIAFNVLKPSSPIPSEWFYGWVMVSTIAMFSAPIRLVWIPNVFIFALPFYFGSLFASIDLAPMRTYQTWKPWCLPGSCFSVRIFHKCAQSPSRLVHLFFAVT
jgi:hypothetical protein